MDQLSGRLAAYDEMYDSSQEVRTHYSVLRQWLASQTDELMAARRMEADLRFRQVGITFSVAGDEAGTERLIPFDLIPRIISAAEWQRLDAGLKQRVRALNMFIHDIYHDHDIVRAGIVPAEQVFLNSQYRPEMQDIDVPENTYCHIAGIDVVRAGAGEFYVLEDNLRVPSGVSYMLENRKVSMRLLPDAFSRLKIAPVAHYPDLLMDNLREVAPRSIDDPTVVVLTPGMYNSAYFEHAFLAQQMGVELVEGRDLFVDQNTVYMRTTRGPRRVDVIYRRVDDDYLDPLSFRADSALGVPGLLSVYRAGRITLANAIGTGIADDKSTYLYVPDMIRFYLDEEPILQNVPTWRCSRPDELSHVLANMHELVVKEVHGAGGYGMLVGPASTRAEVEAFKDRVRASPGAYIAQPTLALSTVPTYVDSGVAPRHVDLRPYVLCGKEMRTVPGGLCRVALTAGSLVVNSSQGGGTKDTWVLEE
jgi:uncharacterized circularly permuted ATP-grasp superfamily protein